MDITLEDYEAYAEYGKILLDIVLRTFFPTLKIQGEETPDISMKTFADALGAQTILVTVYTQMLESFDHWLTHDCPITGHKTRFTNRPFVLDSIDKLQFKSDEEQ